MKDLTKIEAVLAKGGCITSRDKSLLPFGAYSFLQNLRNINPGFEQRKGQRKLHTTADSTNQVMSLFQFSKTKLAEKHLYAQMSDGDVLEATSEPPTVTTGAFGAEVFSGSTGQVPACWGVIDDKLIFSNGKDQHRIFLGTGTDVEKFIVFKGSLAIPAVPQGGEDYTDQVVDSTDGTVAVLDDLNTYANYHCIFVKTPAPINSLAFTVSAANGNTSNISIYYWRNDSTWAAVADVVDGTQPGAATLAQSGTVSWTAPSDIQTKYAFGFCGFWYQIRFSGQLSSSVEVSQVTCGSDWQPIVNVWNSIADYAVEVQIEGTEQWEVWAAGAVDLSELAAGKIIYIGFSSPVEGIFLDPGGTPTAAGNSIASLKYWSGSAWTTVGTITDGSEGLSQSGWVTFARCPAQPMQLNTSIYQAYWYQLTYSQAISEDTTIAITGMPYFDILDLGRSNCNAIWKDRACYTFNRWGAYVYISARDQPLVLNGVDYGILKAGDGRANRVVSMKRFHNELMVWQEEKGVDGGCVTIFEGYSPSTFGKLVLSSKIGAMNAKSTTVVDGVLTATKTDETIKTVAFWISRYGICASDGVTVSIVSDDIQNYFDPTKEECIRYGYEDQHWLDHDPTYNVLRIGIVSGATATTPNVFPVFDLITKTWTFDDLGQKLSCHCNIESTSGTQYPIVQIGGGVADGTVYQLNYGVDDVALPVHMKVEQVLTHKAMVIQLYELLYLLKAQAAGTCKLTGFVGENYRWTKALPMAAEKSNDLSRRHRFTCSLVGDLLVLLMENSSRGEQLVIYEIGVRTKVWEQR